MKNSLALHSVALIVSACLASTATAQITIGTATTAFSDISVSGTSVGGLADDGEYNVSSATLSAAGWAGNQLLPLADIRIGNNGSVLWTSTLGEVGYVNSTLLPSMTASNTVDFGNGGLTVGTALLCPLWDDNYPATAGGTTIRWQVIGGNLIIQWTNEDHFNAQGVGLVTYQLIAYGGATIASGAPLVDFVYNDTLYAAAQFQNDGGSATIGYKNWGSIAAANDVEFGLGGGNDTITDPAFGNPTMKPKVGGYLANNDPTLPKAVRIAGAGVPSVTFCSGDAVGSTCLGCGNNGSAGNGCANSSFASGALLSATGNPSVAADTLTLNCSNMTGPGLFFQANGLGATTTFGDGMLCASVGIARMGVVFPTGGTASYPGGLTPNPITIAGGPIAAGNLKHYQCWYRDALAFCTAATFNTSNGLSITWNP